MSKFEDLLKEKDETFWENYSSRGLAIKLRLLKTVEEVKKYPDYHLLCSSKDDTKFCETCNFLSENYDNLNVKEEIKNLEEDYKQKYKEEFKL